MHAPNLSIVCVGGWGEIKTETLYYMLTIAIADIKYPHPMNIIRRYYQK